MNTELFKTKTFWIGAVAVIGSVATQIFGVEISNQLVMGMNGLIAILLRDAVRKGK